MLQNSSTTMADINIKEPDWKDIPDHCPLCGKDLERDLDDGGVTGWKIDYREGQSNHGEYSEVYCLSCDFPLQRHYAESDVTATEDPFIDPEAWVYRAQILETDTVLKHREAQVRALKEEGNSHSEIADQLGISKSTVGEYSSRINNRIEESAQTLEELGDQIDPLRHIEAQLDGWTVTPASQWMCNSCNTKLEPGTDAKIIGEFVGDQWKPFEFFCSECEPNAAGGVFDEAPDYHITYAIVEGTLDRLGDDYVDQHRYSHDSLTLREPSVRRIIN
jgi:transcriptional regulator with XRE-family HTH domain